jgi:hypothetical protein
MRNAMAVLPRTVNQPSTMAVWVRAMSGAVCRSRESVLHALLSSTARNQAIVILLRQAMQ